MDIEHVLESVDVDLNQCWKQHQGQSSVSYERYSRQRRFQLGETVLRKKRIYLDQKYWVYCREAAEGRPQRPEHAAILKELRRIVATDIGICPISYAVFCETFRQQKSETRMKLAMLVDELSCNVTIQPCFTLVEIELANLLLRNNGFSVYPTKQTVWLPIAFIVGELVPDSEAFDHETNLQIQKSMYDFNTKIKYSQMLSIIEQSTVPAFDDSQFQEEQSRSAKEHRGDFKTLHQAFMIELEGFLDVNLERFLKPIILLREYMTHKSRQYTTTEQQFLCAKVAEKIYDAYNAQEMSTEFPQLHIGCSMHAGTRYLGRPFKKGDLHDHLHAKAALPYCDMFLTERTLGTLLTEKKLELDKKYGCQVLWEDQIIVEELSKIGR